MQWPTRKNGKRATGQNKVTDTVNYAAECALSKLPYVTPTNYNYVFCALPALSGQTGVELAIARPHLLSESSIFADNFHGCGARGRTLTLDFHLVAFFASDEISALKLRWGGMDIDLNVSRLKSPLLGERHPQISRAQNSRYHISDTVELLSPDRMGYIVAEIGSCIATLAILKI